MKQIRNILRTTIIFAVWAMGAFAAAAQANVATITNTDFACPDGMTVTYNLTCAQPVDSVTLYYSPNKRDWLIAKTVTGDHYNQSAGTGKTLFWDNFADKVRQGKFYFKLEVPQSDTCNADDCVMINGVCWATRNVDIPGTFAANPEDAGMFYQWNRNIGWSSTDPMINSNGGTTWDNTNPTGTTWESANDPCPCGWRVPTQSELQSLVNSGSSWSNLNGVPGRFFGSGNTLFLPAAGLRYYSDGSLYYAGTYGYYWSSTQYDSDDAYFLYFYSGTFNVLSYYTKTNGFPVRCVAEH